MEISKQDLKRIIQKCTCAENIEYDTDIFEDLKVDSIIFVQILVDIEELIGNELPAELFVESKWKTINIMYEVLQKNVISKG